MVSRELLSLGLESGLPWVTASILQDSGFPVQSHTPVNVCIIYISFPSPSKWLFTGKHKENYTGQTRDVGRKKQTMYRGRVWRMQFSMDSRRALPSQLLTIGTAPTSPQEQGLCCGERESADVFVEEGLRWGMKSSDAG